MRRSNARWTNDEGIVDKRHLASKNQTNLL